MTTAGDDIAEPCMHDWMPFGSSLGCRKCGADIRYENSAQNADFPTELRKMAKLIAGSGLPHCADMLAGAADEIDRLRTIKEPKP